MATEHGSSRRVAGTIVDGAAVPTAGTIRTIVIVGNGMTSARLCERLVGWSASLDRDPDRFRPRAKGDHRRAGSRPRIVVFAEESHPAYDRVHLASLMATSTGDLTLHPASWYGEHGIELHLGDKVASIDRDARTIVSASGVTIVYDRLVLATGSRPFVPPLPGTDHPDVLVFRTLDDLSSIRKHARTAGRAVVIGGGLLGLEAAKVLADLGLKVDIVEAAPHLMPRQLDEDAAALLRKKIEGLGIRVFVGKAPQAIDEQEGGRGLCVRLADGEPLSADLVVVAAGIRPRADLASSCGLALDKNGGIDVDDQLQTSDPNILAIGECASHRGATYGLVPPGYQMADVAADRLTGGDTIFSGSDMSAKLKLLGVAVACLGRFDDRSATVLTYTAEGCYRKLLLGGNGRIVGAMAVGEWSDIDDVMRLMETRGRTSARARRQFPRVGRIRAPIRSVDPMVCTCMRVSQSTLTKAVADGCTSVAALGLRTGAGTLCGECKPQLARLAGTRPVVATRSPSLFAGAIVAGAFILAWLLARPLGAALHAIFAARHHFWAQLTGYSALGLTALGLSLSVRKRWRKPLQGGYERSRLVHVAVNVLALAALVAHTGLRLGDNLNRALLVCFLAAGLAGIATAAVAAVAPNGARPKRWSYWAHVLLTWPLLALLLTHVFHAYYY